MYMFGCDSHAQYLLIIRLCNNNNSNSDSVSMQADLSGAKYQAAPICRQIKQRRFCFQFHFKTHTHNGNK